MRWIAVIGMFVAVCWVLIAFGSLAYNGSVRYRLTAEVVTPEGLKTGSGVIETSRKILRSWVPFPGSREHHGLSGEAVAVDLGERGILFLLLTCREANTNVPQDCAALKLPERVLQRTGEVSKVAAPDEREVDWYVRKARIIENARGVRDVAIQDMPFLVRFRDLNDPKTVEAVDPTDLGSAFGNGVSLGQVKIVFTSDPVTTGIENRLGWFDQFFNGMLDGSRLHRLDTKQVLSNALTAWDFKRNEK